MKVYGILVRNKVEFGAAHVLETEKVEAENVSHYAISKTKLKLSSGTCGTPSGSPYMLVLITIFGAILMFSRD